MHSRTVEKARHSYVAVALVSSVAAAEARAVVRDVRGSALSRTGSVGRDARRSLERVRRPRLDRGNPRASEVTPLRQCGQFLGRVRGGVGGSPLGGPLLLPATGDRSARGWLTIATPRMTSAIPDHRAGTGQRAADGFDHDRHDRDEERPGIHARGRPSAQRCVEPDVDEYLAADDQVCELRDQRRLAPVGRPAGEQDQRDQRDATGEKLRGGDPGDVEVAARAGSGHASRARPRPIPMRPATTTPTRSPAASRARCSPGRRARPAARRRNRSPAPRRADA